MIAAAALAPADAQAADEALVEFHFKPVPNLQIAIWLEDADGNFVDHVYVTQATGKLGIGNRPGRWDFVSSWRAPYGPRVSVLPIWAHRQPTEYPKIVFYDDDPADQESLGWHENSSSPESYFCRPLTASEHETISVDTMTCPSPQVFQSDKGYFAPGESSRYPPRNDLIEFEAIHDSPDAPKFSDLNKLDAYTAATPAGDAPEFTTALLPQSALDRGPLTAYIEVNLERDENTKWDFDRDKDHFVDTRLPGYGIEYLGQPSVLYKVTFEPRKAGFQGTSAYAGYGEWNGASGAVNAPDGTINTAQGSGADRLKEYTLNGETFRFGVYSHGADAGGTTDSDGTDSDGTDSDSSGTDSDTGDDSSDTGWSSCTQRELPPIKDFNVEGVAFDEVRAHFTIPEEAIDLGGDNMDLSRVRVYYLNGDMALDESNLGAAIETTFSAADLDPPGTRTSVDIDQLWGNYTYQFAIRYEDRCANKSPLVAASITTETQQFQQVEGFCFLATAAYGAPWIAEVGALRYFRDAFLKISPTGRDLVRFYYTYSPPLARVIQREPVMRGMVRAVVQPIADVARLSATPG
ncbi:MAG: CFI-box-CTERM domain-containing protein [Nannocystaceae bacterium]